MVQMLQQMAMGLASQLGEEAMQMVAQQLMQMGGQPMPGQMGMQASGSGQGSGEENPIVAKARQNARTSTQAD